MSENKCCENCKHFKDEGAYEIGLCGKDGVVTQCGTSCSDYSSKFNGWTELTPDRLEELSQIEPYRIILARFFDDGSVKSKTRTEPCYTPLEVAAANTKLRFFYYILPKLTKE